MLCIIGNGAVYVLLDGRFRAANRVRDLRIRQSKLSSNSFRPFRRKQNENKNPSPNANVGSSDDIFGLAFLSEQSTDESVELVTEIPAYVF